MFASAFNSNSKNLITRLVLVVALLFASAHVALHELDVHSEELNGGSECQVCRLGHTPAATFAIPQIATPTQFLLYVVPAAKFNYLFSASPSIHRARAPPISV